MVEEIGFVVLAIASCFLLYYWIRHPPGGKNMAKINENVLAIKISAIEGKKVEVNIAQIKEVLKCALEILNDYSDEEIVALVRHHKKK